MAPKVKRPTHSNITPSSKRPKTSSKYIGATLEEVRRAIQEGRLQYAKDRMYTWFMDVRGAGTLRLTHRLARNLIARWWKGGPGTQVVVGFVHPDVYSNSFPTRQNLTKVNLVTVAVTRPKITPKMLTEPIEDIFRRALWWESQKHNHSVFFSQFGVPRWNWSWNTGAWTVSNRKHTRWGVENTYATDSYMFVWPAGIVDNRTSMAMNKIQMINMKRDVYSKIPQKEVKRALSNEARDARMKKQKHNRHIQTVRAALNVIGTQRKHARVMNELRALPRGVLHPSFPGGSNFEAFMKKMQGSSKG
jgi:hypothetical protein